MLKPVQRWDAPANTTLHENNESGLLVFYDEHELVVAELKDALRFCWDQGIAPMCVPTIKSLLDK